MGFTVANRARLLASFAAGLLVISACSDCKEDSSCLPRGTYVEANELLGATSARICFDDDCKTLVPGEDDGSGGVDGNVTNGFYRGDWTDGREFTLTINVYNSAGDTLGSISEKRKMDPGGCACGVLFYDWKDGALHRLN
jgi:hypothetical protein